MHTSTLIIDTLRILSFRKPSHALIEQPRAYVIFGLCCAWLAGIGRYWDHPDAWLLQYLGLGSVIYVIVLASLLWLLLWPVTVKRLRWQTVLIFVALTSPLAWLYAIPVERFMTAVDAAQTNLYFLLTVALWRVILLVLFLKRVARLNGFQIVILTLLPLTLIVAGLAALNLEHATFNLMAGLHDEIDPRGAAHFMVTLMAVGSVILLPITLIAYGVMWHLAAQQRKLDVLLARQRAESALAQNNTQAS